uniref:WH2 domain-containing protein n=1 Tax=Anopheles dirus TaxID=7168 RepID=A0A182MY82_9DIPT
MSPPPPPAPPPPPPSSPPCAPPAPASVTAGPAAKATVSNGPAAKVQPDHNDQLMAAIRNGINLKPAKTNDRSTPAFIKQSNGVLDDNDEASACSTVDKSSSIDEMKDALQAELRNTLKRKIKKQDLEEGDCRKNDEIERAIGHTRNEVQLKLNGSSSTPPAEAPKVDNPLKTIIDIVDKTRGGAVAPATSKQPSPVLTQKKAASVPSTPTVNAIVNGTATLRKVSATQYPFQNGGTTVLHVTPSTTAPIVKPSVPAQASTPKTVGTAGQKTDSSPATASKLISNGTNGSSTSVTPQVSPVATSVNASKSTAVSNGPVKVANGSLPSGKASNSNGTAFKINSFQSKLPPSSAATASIVKPSNANTYSNTLPRANGVTKAAPKTSTSAVPAKSATAVKISFGSFGDSVRSTPNNTAGTATLRNGNHAKFEPLTIDISSNGGGSSTNSPSPTTPRELLSPQVRSGAAAIRPSQIRTLTKAGSVVSHTDILETSKPIAKLPVTLVEPAPVLTAAAAVSPPPKKLSTTVAPLATASPKEHTPLFEKATKEPPRSPLNRWADSSSASGGTARKLLLTHGRPNFTIKRSNSRQGFDVDVPDTKTDTVKPVFRILTDLERMEQQQEEQTNQRQYVSFAKDLSNAPNNHPDVAVVTKTVAPSAPVDPFLTTLKDIKIDIGEMKVVNAKNS